MVMDSLKRELLARRQQLVRAIEKAEQAIAAAPDGTLRIDASKDKVRYFHVTGPSSRGVYIPEKDRAIAELLANKEYAQRVLPKAISEIHRIDLFLKKLETDSADLEFKKLVQPRKPIVSPFLLDDETYKKMWSAQSYERSASHPENLRFKTRRGEMVRSKSEVFIANTYFELGIPYRYDCPLELNNHVILHPDFTLLDTWHSQITYHEHLGLLGKADYWADTQWKLNEYRKNGIYVGKNLILTSETDEYPFDPELFRKRTIDTFLK